MLGAIAAQPGSLIDFTMTDSLKDFFAVYTTRFSPLRCVFTPDLPPEMLVSQRPDASGWVEWRMLPQPCQNPINFALLENEAASRLPKSFKAWFQNYYTLDVDVGIVRLPACPLNNPLKDLKYQVVESGYYSKRCKELGLIPFGDEKLIDAGPLCFDTREPVRDDEWPVVYWDHEYDQTSEEIGPRIFSSFPKLIKCCTHFLQENKSARDLVRDLYRIDPEGAGGPGRAYWEGWGG